MMVLFQLLLSLTLPTIVVSSSSQVSLIHLLLKPINNSKSNSLPMILNSILTLSPCRLYSILMKTLKCNCKEKVSLMKSVLKDYLMAKKIKWT